VRRVEVRRVEVRRVEVRRVETRASPGGPTVLGVSDSCRTAETCPACGAADLRPYGNGSKWICPKCYFLMPCCEGGELSARPSTRSSS
jgi:hypothetical protein